VNEVAVVASLRDFVDFAAGYAMVSPKDVIKAIEDAVKERRPARIGRYAVHVDPGKKEVWLEDEQGNTVLVYRR